MLISVLQTDFEKDVDLACRSGERPTGESVRWPGWPTCFLFPPNVCVCVHMHVPSAITPPLDHPQDAGCSQARLEEPPGACPEPTPGPSHIYPTQHFPFPMVPSMFLMGRGAGKTLHETPPYNHPSLLPFPGHLCDVAYFFIIGLSMGRGRLSFQVGRMSVAAGRNQKKRCAI